METLTTAIEAPKLKQQLRKWLSETDAKSACAFGVRNYLKEQQLVNPRVYLADGNVARPLFDAIPSESAAAALFVKREYASRGTAGCVCYDISGTGCMVAVMWSTPLFSEKASENKFSVHCLKTGECNENLFKFLSESAKVADGEMVQEENGFRVCGCMGREARCLLIVDVFEAGRIGKMLPSDPIRAGRVLEEQLRKWLNEAQVKNVCSIGINNYSSVTMTNPRMYLFGGTCNVQPPQTIEKDMGAAGLFCKREFSLLGTSGVLTYDIKGIENMLAVVWLIPLCETLLENRFHVAVIPKTECDLSLYERLIKDSKRARDGEMMMEAGALQVSARMEPTPHSVLLVNIRTVQKQGWLW